jgi:type II secretory pathway pseudopilin PulG
VASWKRSNRRQRRYQFGFTLIENLVIVSMIGILSVLAAPSVSALMDSLRIDQTIVEVRTALQTTQRQAIRRSQVCSVALQVEEPENGKGNNGNGKGNNGNGKGNNGNGKGNNGNGKGHNGKGKGNNGNGNGHNSETNDATKNAVTGNCLLSGEPDLPNNVSVATNLVSSSPSSSSTSNFEIKYGVLGGAEFAIQGLNTSTTRDASGKIIAFVPERQDGKKKCIAVSSTLGLTRVGNYVGELDSESITQTGVCTALEWNKQ